MDAPHGDLLLYDAPRLVDSFVGHRQLLETTLGSFIAPYHLVEYLFSSTENFLSLCPAKQHDPEG